jgi:cytoskeletal protein RodZ
MITAGEVLKKQRKNLDRSIEQVALDTKIQPRFIKYIESNDFEKFDSPIYAQGFIKIYANYLDLNEDRILAIYRRSVPEIKKENKTIRETIKSPKKLKITPKLIAVSLSIIFLVGILSYIGYQIYQFQSPPEIQISSPENETSVEERSIEVKGVTDTNTSLFVNDIPVDIDTEGNFQYEVELNPGVNLITVLAKKDNSTQESVETVKVTYNEPISEEESPNLEEETEEIQVNKVRLEIVNSSVWLEFNVDKINKLSQIVQVGEDYEYEVEKQFSLTTGIINSTKVFFNDEELEINRGSSSVGSLNCEIVNNNQINCQ